MSVYEKFNELTVEDFKEMSPEEISFWFGVGQQQKQVNEMRRILVDNADIKEASQTARTIKIDSKVIN